MARDRRVVLLVIDGLGVGALPDAADYGDEGSSTLGNAARAGSLHVPVLDRLGLGRVEPAVATGAEPVVGVHGRMAERSAGKDSMTGHWEIAGVITEIAFETFPTGFPDALIDAFSAAISKPVLGNLVTPGPEALAALGEEARTSGSPIVYTSADSVFQVAAHVEAVPSATLYDWCERARVLVGDRVARVIARPFRGRPGSFERISGARRDFPVELPRGSLVELLHGRRPTIAVGKIADLFPGHAFTAARRTGTDAEAMDALDAGLEELDGGLVFANFGDLDTKYGHRNDADGWCRALEAVDRYLARLLPALRDDDVLIITGDHGNDPTTPSTDHAREYVPVLAVSGRNFRRGVPGRPIGVRPSFADAGATVHELLIGTPSPAFPGRSFAGDIG